MENQEGEREKYDTGGYRNMDTHTRGKEDAPQRFS